MGEKNVFLKKEKKKKTQQGDPFPPTQHWNLHNHCHVCFSELNGSVVQLSPLGGVPSLNGENGPGPGPGSLSLSLAL